MLQVEMRGQVAIVDVRERIRRGEHPKKEILDYVQSAKQGTVIEVHLPHRAEPLVAALEGIGVPAVLHAIAPDHYRLMCVKM